MVVHQKSTMSKLFIFALLIIECCTQIEALGHKRTGNWCEHTVTKHISCRVRNGTEMHVEKVKPAWCNYKLSPPFSSRERNCGNSFRVVFRPIYRIEFQTIRTKKMSCCPGFSGQNCEIECLNCTRIADLEERVDYLMQLATADANNSDFSLPGMPAVPANPGPPDHPGLISGATVIGEKGRRGDPGTPGLTGPPGPRGPPGQSGMQGVPGLPGPAIPGPRGSQGAPGVPGLTGFKGEKGDTGSKGITSFELMALIEEIGMLKNRIVGLEQEVVRLKEIGLFPPSDMIEEESSGDLLGVDRNGAPGIPSHLIPDAGAPGLPKKLPTLNAPPLIPN